jgi:Xaa-Pro dipeptidase
MEKLDLLYPEHLRVVSARADAALAAEGFDALVVHAGIAPMRFLDDHEYPFKANPQFKLWVPVTDNPHCVLIYRPGNRPTLLFWSAKDYWHRPAELPTAGWTRHVELREFAEPRESEAAVKALSGRVAFIAMPEAAFDAGNALRNPPALLSRLDFARAAKTPYELECLREASRLGARGHRAAAQAFLAGASEYAAHQRYLDACGRREEEMPYNNIVAFNDHAAVLHYQHLARRAPQESLSFLVDAGAEYRGYAADITRTHAAAPGLFGDLIARLDSAQQSLCGEVRSGRDYRDIHLAAHRHVGRILAELGIVKLAADDAVESGVTGSFFPHGIGHLLGLQVHDVGGLQAGPTGGEIARPAGHPYLRMTRRLEPGFVVTIEPGIYFIDMLLAEAKADARGKMIDWSMVEALRPYGGVRIEDDVVATTGEPLNLTREAFAAAA